MGSVGEGEKHVSTWMTPTTIEIFILRELKKVILLLV